MASYRITLPMECVLSENKPVPEVQSQPVHKPMALYVPEKNELLNKNSVIVQEGKHF
jgi:hypothetical protein